ncbi:unnamed protein product, partial [Rotaria magnacalcarata]
ATQSNDDVHTHSPTEESENVQQAVASATTPNLDSTLPVASSPIVPVAVSPSKVTSTTKKPASAAHPTRPSVGTKAKPSSA